MVKSKILVSTSDLKQTNYLSKLGLTLCNTVSNNQQMQSGLLFCDYLGKYKCVFACIDRTSFLCNVLAEYL